MSVRTNISEESFPFADAATYSIYVVTLFSLIIIPYGVITNILNIIVFIKTGSRDNVTVSLVALSISDLAYLVIISPHEATYAGNLIRVNFGVSFSWLFDPLVLMIPFYWYAFLFYETSTLITVYISVVRCACVAMPFKVKDVFTSTRAIITFVVFFVSVSLLHIPMFMSKRPAMVFDKVTNSTQLKYVHIDDNGLADTINDIVSRNALPCIASIVLVISVIILVTKLRMSAKFRSASSNSGFSQPTSDKNIGETQLTTTTTGGSGQSEAGSTSTKHKNDVLPSKSPSSEEKLNSETTKQSSQILSPREAQAVRSVTLVAIIFLLCQIPFVIASWARLIDPNFEVQDRLHLRACKSFNRTFNTRGLQVRAAQYSDMVKLLNSTPPVHHMFYGELRHDYSKDDGALQHQDVEDVPIKSRLN
ncbi:hypothetical protein PoB_000051900 [Plakobranchus ocellatus]|uniref:G-protein coupled receptors family 1 profile domain-containing protein n=1 Tax=Plakobranchus ocellatus TaxID=259542 RepID=A0AAV3XVP8_9GAST|nr:hypothetical protein PoB_000051900 [Plakobranchus ocellatus]